MGWGSGSTLMSDVIDVVEEVVPDHATRVRLYSGLILAFEDKDCDTLDECVGESKAFDQAYRHFYPDEE